MKKKNNMELIDYTGKLNEHDKYIKMLDRLKRKCKYIDITLIDNKERNVITEKFKEDIIYYKKRNNNIVRLKTTDEFFNYLKRFETFCKYYISENLGVSDKVEYTDFGLDDIAFYDDNETPLLSTETHEGIILIRDDFIEESI